MKPTCYLHKAYIFRAENIQIAYAQKPFATLARISMMDYLKIL